jgi:TRAP-type C4-dicarboxylate transport system substrate-binding protein
VILANKFFEVQKHLALTNHQYNPQSVLISKKVWDTLSADEKKIVQDAAIEAGRLPAPGQPRRPPPASWTS